MSEREEEYGVAPRYLEEERAEKFARILFGVDVEKINMSDDAQWRRLLDAVDFAIESKIKGVEAEKDEEGNVIDVVPKWP